MSAQSSGFGMLSRKRDSNGFHCKGLMGAILTTWTFSESQLQTKKSIAMIYMVQQFNIDVYYALTMDIVSKQLYRKITIQNKNDKVSKFSSIFIPNEQNRGNWGEGKTPWDEPEPKREPNLIWVIQESVNCGTV